METYIRNRLGLLGGKVGEGISVCQAIALRVEQGQTLSTNDEVQIERLKVAMARLMEEVQNYTHMHNGPPSPEMEDMLDELTTLNMKADDVIVELTVGLGRGVGTRQVGRAYVPSEQSQHDVTVGAQSNTTSRLPELGLPTFKGEVLQWYEFWSKFSASVESRRGLNDVDKLTYLQSCLEGEAKELIAGLDTTNENYKIAVDTLKEEFGEKGIVIDAHYSALFDIPKANQDAKDNKRVLTEIERHLRVLNTMGEVTGQNNAIRTIILKKFSNDIKSDLSMMMSPTEETVDNIISALKVIIKARNDRMSRDSNLTSAPNQVQPSTPNFTTETLYSQEIKQNSGPSMKRKYNSTMRSPSEAKQPRKAFSKPNASTSADKRFHGRGPGKGKATGSTKPKDYPQPLRCIFCSGKHIHENCLQYPTVEDRKLKLKNRCYLCLKENHSAHDCVEYRNKVCIHCNKRGHHNRCLCPTKYVKSTNNQGNNGKPDNGERTNILYSQMDHDTILQTAVASIRTGFGVVKARLLFDSGSQRSYLNASTAKKLKLTHQQDTSLTVFTFGSTTPKTISANLVNIHILLRENIIDVLAYVVPTTTGPIPSHHDFKTKLRYKYPSLVWAEDTEKDETVDIIIGNDYYYKFIMPEMKQITDNLYAIRTELGWIPTGSFLNDRTMNYQLSVITYVEQGCVCKNQEFFVLPDPAIRNDDIKVLWELDAIGITDSPKVVQEEEVIQFFNRTTQFVDDRYYVKWPWVEYPPHLPVNFGLCRGRLESLLKRLNPHQIQRYHDVLVEQLERGIIEEIYDTTLPTSHPVHYLPHHCVIQEHKSTKLRIVYDASAKTKGHCSLNEMLYKGPLMLEDLTSMLLRFRYHSIGILADVEKAFLQIGLQTEDRDVTRFLWVKDIKHPPSDTNLIHLRFCRVPFGIISSPFLLAATIRKHILGQNSELGNRMASSLYVDNLVTGVDSLADATKLYVTATGCLQELSMNLRGWNSNAKEFLDSISPSHRDAERIVSVLGMKWDTDHDTFSLAFTASKLDKPAATKRQVLRIIASVFDPLGFVAPFTLPTRSFLQNLWRRGLKWDTPLTPDETHAWDSCVRHLQLVPSFTTRRCYATSGLIKGPVELHCFTDASQDAYVAVVYLRISFQSHFDVSYVISKSRVTPLNRKASLTIPKLELLAVVIGTRLLAFVQKALDLTSALAFLWTDNQAVLGWLHTDRLLPPWVSRRVGEIHKLRNVRFKYVPTSLNPADVATRPLLAARLPDIWINGPDFLRLPAGEWRFPQPQEPVSPASPDLREVGDSVVPAASNALCTLSSDGTPNRDADLTLPPAGVILPVPVIRQLQLRYFPKEISGNTTDLSRSLGIFLDGEGVLRCKGRYQNALLPYDQRCPILLPNDSIVTQQLIERLHRDNYHVGVAHTLSLLRQHYWVPQGRSIVSRVLKHCTECVKYGGGPYKLPPMPDLPAERVNYSAPFTYTGLDYLGPLIVVEHGVKQKRWVCLFTCMAVRAVHLEVVSNLTAEEFILCLRRFISSRGPPKLILSDNAAHLKLTAALLSAPGIHQHKIEWRFITELSPWQGGVYERMVALVKHCLHRTLDKTLLNDTQLQTIMKEIEAVLNTRPLTTVGAEHEIILTPAHFLRASGPPNLQPPTHDPSTYRTGIQQAVVSGWKRTSALLEEFRRMFINQYLLSLRERHCPTVKQPRVLSPKAPSVGDVVQVKGDTLNRALWKVGKITALSTGVDGLVRSAQVTLDNGTVLNRSIAHLYPLEMDVSKMGTEPPVNGTDAESPSSPPSSDMPDTRPSCSQSVTNQPAQDTRDPNYTPTALPKQDQPQPLARPQRMAAHRARNSWRRQLLCLFSLATSVLQSSR